MQTSRNLDRCPDSGCERHYASLKEAWGPRNVKIHSELVLPVT